MNADHKFAEGVQKSNSEQIYVILTDFDGFAQTRRCLDALRGSFGVATRIVVVDHGTTAETRNGITTEFPYVTRVEASSELWWTGAINTGIQFALEAGATRIVLLNNDCYVQPDTLFHLVKLSGKNPAAIIAAIQRDSQSKSIGSLTISCNFLLGFPTVLGVKSANMIQFEQGLISANLIQGGRAVLIPVEIFRTIGLFDSVVFPHYSADHDFYLRARAAGVRLYVGLHAMVDVDTTRTSSAFKPIQMSWSQFRESLRSVRSHRSIGHVSSLFKRYYPIPQLYMLGVFLFVSRYALAYAIGRIFSKNTR